MGSQKSKEELYAIPEPNPPQLTQEPSWEELNPEPKTGLSAEAIKQLTDQLEASAPQELPERSRYEALFKRSLGGVKVYTGISQLSVLNTDAAAGKDELMFAGAAPTDVSMAHELVHFLQYQQGGEPSGELSQGGEGSEQEARLLARRAALGLGEHVQPSASPSAKVSRNSGGSGGGGAPPPAAPVRISGGDIAAGGASWSFENEGSWRARRDRTYTEGDLQTSTDPNLTREVTVHVAGQEWKIETPEDWVLVADRLGDAEVDNIAGSYEVGGAHANALAQYAVTTEKVEVKAGAAANLTLAAGKLVLQTDMLSMSVLNETIKGKAGVELEAAAVAEVSGEVGLSIGAGSDGPEASLASEAKAFAGGRAGIRGFIVMKWTPQGAADKDIAGASVGVEGWAGAAAAAKLEVSLFPELKASGYYAAALGWGAGAKAEIKIHLVDAALLSLTLAGRGAARALEGIGMDAVAQAIDKMLNELWIDDAARGVANDPSALAALSIDQCKDLIDKMLDGATLNEDEQAILKVLAHADGLGGLGTVVYGVKGGMIRMLDKFHGDEYDQLLELLYVSQNSVDDVPVDDDVARELIAKGLHTRMSRHRVTLLINELLDGFTGDADEDALLKVCRDRVDVLTDGMIRDILDNLHGSQDAALRGFLWLEGRLNNVPVDDDCARAVIEHGFHTGVSDLTRLNVLLDALISGVTGDDDEAAIVRLLLDVPTYAKSLDAKRLNDALSDVDGEEYEQLLVALRRGDRIKFTDAGIDFDDNVARIAVSNDLHKGVMGADECQKAIRELISGFTGDADEAAIVAILKENMGSIRTILPVALGEQVKRNVHGAEYDELLAVFVTAGYMDTDITIDDDLVRAMVRIGLHTHSNNQSRLLEFVEALLDGATLDGDEQALLAIIRDCESVRSQIDDALLGRIARKVDGEEYTQLVVLLRKVGRIDLASPPVSISLDDDIARAAVDEIGVAALSDGERKRLIQELNRGFTGDDDEARILQICRESDVLQTMSKADIDETLSNVHGEERSLFFELLLNKAPAQFSLPNDYFDDDCARYFVDQGLHLDSKLDDKDCRAMIHAMLEGFTGNDDETRILKILTERESVLGVLNEGDINALHDDLHGEEQETFFVYLARHNRLNWENLHSDFDDNTARRFVDEQLHVQDGATTARRQALIDKMLEGFTGNDDEDRILTILDSDPELLKNYDDARLRAMLRAFDGAQNTALWLRIAQAKKLNLSWPDYIQLGFDDDVARAIVDENLHAELSGEDLKKMLTALTTGWLGDADEQRVLVILRDQWAKVESHLDERFVVMLCQRFAGEEYERLLGILFKNNKLPRHYLQPPELNDRTARGLVLEGAHRNASVEYNMRIYRALIDGATTNGDEENLLTLIRDVPSLLDQPGVTIEELHSNFDGVEESRLLVLLLELGKLELSDPRIDDDAIREFVKQGKHTDTRITADQLNNLVQRLIDGVTGPDDERAIIEIVKARESQLAAVLNGISWEVLADNVSGDNGHELAQFLYGKDFRRDDIVNSLDVSRSVWFVDNGVTDTMPNPHLAKVVDALINGFEQERLTQLLRQQAPKIKDIVTSVLRLNFSLAGEARGEGMALVYQNGSEQQKDEVLQYMDAVVGARFVRQSLFEGMSGPHLNKLVTALLRSGDANGNRNAVLVVRYASEQGAAAIDAIVGGDRTAFLARFNDTYRADVEAMIGGGGGGGGSASASGGGREQAPRFPVKA